MKYLSFDFPQPFKYVKPFFAHSTYKTVSGLDLAHGPLFAIFRPKIFYIECVPFVLLSV